MRLAEGSTVVGVCRAEKEEETAEEELVEGTEVTETTETVEATEKTETETPAEGTPET